MTKPFPKLVKSYIQQVIKKALDVPYRTLWDWINASEEYRQKYDEAREEQDDLIREKVDEVLDFNWLVDDRSIYRIEEKLSENDLSQGYKCAHAHNQHIVDSKRPLKY